MNPAVVPILVLFSTCTALAGQDREYRDREAMRPSGMDVRIVGIEEGDNGFREETPALNHARIRDAYVDVDDLHARKMAQFEDGAMHDSPVAGLDPADGKKMVRRPKRSGPRPARGDPLPWVIGILGVMGLVLLLLVRATGRTPLKRTERFVITSRG